MNFRYRILPLILVIASLLSFCGCNQVQTDEIPAETTPVLTNSIFGTWYPHPEVTDVVFDIYEDGTCVIFDKTYNWTIKTITEDEIVLIAGENGKYQLIFSQLNDPVPLLTIPTCGVYIQNHALWQHIRKWYCDESGKSFTVSFEELARFDCDLILYGNEMIVEVKEGPYASYIIEFFGPQVVVTDADLHSTVYIPAN